MPWLESTFSMMCSGSNGAKNDGQPVPELNFAELEKSGRPPATQT
jgi:hypothetical protein